MLAPDSYRDLRIGSIYVSDGRYPTPTVSTTGSGGTLLLGRYGGDPYEPYSHQDVALDAAQMATHLKDRFPQVLTPYFRFLTPRDPLAVETAVAIDAHLDTPHLHTEHVELNVAGTYPPVVKEIGTYLVNMCQDRQFQVLGENVLVLVKPRLLETMTGQAIRGHVTEVSHDWVNPDHDPEYARLAQERPQDFLGH